VVVWGGGVGVVWGFGGVGIGVQVSARRDSNSQILRIRIDGCAHFCAQENPRIRPRIVPETPESAKFGTKIQVRVVCPKSTPQKKRRKHQI